MTTSHFIYGNIEKYKQNSFPLQLFIDSSHLTYFGVLEMCRLHLVRLVPIVSGPLHLVLLLQSQDQRSPPPGSSLGSRHIPTVTCLPNAYHILKLSVLFPFKAGNVLFSYTVTTAESRAGLEFKTLSVFVWVTEIP